MNPLPIAALEVFPRVVSELVASLSESQLRAHAPGEPFSVVEHAWHLADLEREGFLVRLRRMVTESAPFLPDFDGERIARERQYALADARLGAELFAHARGMTAAALSALGPAQLSRTGFQEGVGPVAVSELSRRIFEHDLAHAAELEPLLIAISAPTVVREAVHAFLGDGPRLRSTGAVM